MIDHGFGRHFAGRITGRSVQIYGYDEGQYFDYLVQGWTSDLNIYWIDSKQTKNKRFGAIRMADNDRMVYRRKDGRWADKRHGASRPAGLYNTQAEAAAEARKHLENSGGGELEIKGRDGKIRSKDTIAKPDPFPPRDKEH